MSAILNKQVREGIDKFRETKVREVENLEAGDQNQKISFASAAKMIGASPASLWRWGRDGIFGVKLEVVVVGARGFTTRGWLREFIAKTTAIRLASEQEQANYTPTLERELVEAGLK
jgi:hypothetical protein